MQSEDWIKVTEYAFGQMTKEYEVRGSSEESISYFKEIIADKMESENISIYCGWVCDLPGDAVNSMIEALIEKSKTYYDASIIGPFMNYLEEEIYDTDVDKYGQEKIDYWNKIVSEHSNNLPSWQLLDKHEEFTFN